MLLINALKDLKYSREDIFIEAVWNMIWAIIKIYLSNADNQSVYFKGSYFLEALTSLLIHCYHLSSNISFLLQTHHHLLCLQYIFILFKYTCIFIKIYICIFLFVLFVYLFCILCSKQVKIKLKNVFNNEINDTSYYTGLSFLNWLIG